MYSLKISGTVVNPAPQTMQVAIQDIDAKATRDAQGLLHRDRVATKRKITLTIGSYLLECMILEIYEGKAIADTWWIDLEFKNVLDSLSTLIKYDVEDPKGIQGNINNFSWDDRLKISNALHEAYNKACDAISFEVNDKNQEKAINKWREVFGSAFPKYDEE